MAVDCDLWMRAVNKYAGVRLPLRPRGWKVGVDGGDGVGDVTSGQILTGDVGVPFLRDGGGFVCMSLLIILSFFLLLSCIPNVRTCST